MNLPSYKPTIQLKQEQTSGLPKDFGGYRLLRELSGGMALVYEAEQKNPKRRVVLKIPRGGLLLTEESRKRFLREVELAANIDHSGIVPVFDAGEVDGTPYYTMPLVEGQGIDDYSKSLDGLEEKLLLFRQLCKVVGALHAKALVHRDLKPANILVDTNNNIRLLDFGLAKAAEEISDVSLSPTVMGTVEYMAPEQAGAAKQVGPQADVYAIGVMLYKAVTGHSPYPASKDLTTQLRIIAETPPKPPQQLQRTLPSNLAQLILRCLHKDPAKRPDDASALEQALSELKFETPRKNNKNSVLIGLGALLMAAGLTSAYWSQQEGSHPALPETKPSESGLSAAAEAPGPLETIHYSTDQISGLSNAAPTESSSSPVPVEYWPLYHKVQKELKEDFDRRRQAAWIFLAPEDARQAIEFEVLQGEQRSAQRLLPGEASVVYLSGDRAAHYAYEGRSHSFKTATGEIAFIPLGR